MLPIPISGKQVRKSMDQGVSAVFVNRCISAMVSSDMLPSQQLAALGMFKHACVGDFLVRRLDGCIPVVHDELLLHRANSLFAQAQDPAFEATGIRQRARTPLGCISRTR